MPRLLAALAFMVFASPTVAQPTPAPSRFDGCGDPLPEGAIVRWGTNRFRVGGSIGTTVLSGDGRWLAVVADSLIHVLDASTGNERWTGRLINDGNPLFSPDGRYLVTGGERNSLLLCEAGTGKQEREFQIPEGEDPPSVAFSGDGLMLAAAVPQDRKVVQVLAWNIPSGRTIARFKLPEAHGVAIALSPDGRTMACWGPQGPIPLLSETDRKHEHLLRLICLATGKQTRVLRIDSGRVTTALFSPDGRSVAAANGSLLEDMSADPREGTIWLWDVTTGRELRRLPPQPAMRHGIFALTFAPDGRTLAAVCEEGLICLCDPSTGKTRERFSCLMESPVVFLPDGRVLACEGLGAFAARVLDIRTGRPQSVPPPGHRGPVEAIAFARDGSLISASAGHEIYRWGLQPNVQPRRVVEPRTERTAAFCMLSDDGQYLVCSGGSVATTVRRTSDGVKVWLDLRGQHVNSLLHRPLLRFLPGGAILASLEQGKPREWQLSRWEAATGQPLPALALGRPNPSQFTVSDDGKLLIVVTNPGAAPLAPGQKAVARVWSLPAGRFLRSLHVPSPQGDVVLSPDHRRLALMDGFEKVSTWDTATGKRVFEIARDYNDASRLMFSPDSRLFAVASDQWFGHPAHIDLLDAATGRLRKRWLGHHGMIRCLAFSRDNKLLASGGWDSTVVVWDVTGQRQPAPPRQLSVKELDALWTDLASANADRAAVSVQRLANHPAIALPLLRERLKPVLQRDPARLAGWIGALDDRRFPVRQQATHDLRSVLQGAAPALRRALAGSLSAEARQRVQNLLGETARWTPEQRQATRAVQVLEALGNPDASAVLHRLASGAPSAQATQEAKAALERLRVDASK